MPDHDKLSKLIQWHLDFHTHVQIQDVYKMLFQGVFGAEHLLGDIKRARAYLDEEWLRVPADRSKILLEPVSIDGKIVRANIQRCKAEGIEADHLWQVFYRSATQIKADKKEFEIIWDAFLKLCQTKALPFDPEAVLRFGHEAKANHWPAKHHTTAYRDANYPAYRVALQREFNKIVHIKLDQTDNFI